MDPQQILDLASKLAALSSQIAPLLQVVGQIGLDGAIRAGRALSGLDDRLSELAAQQRANAEADRATMERLVALEMAVTSLRDQVVESRSADRVLGQRLTALEASVAGLQRAVTASGAVP